MRLAVARIGRPHGIKGEATVELFTDQPELRFQVGNRLECDSTSHSSLEISGARIHKGIWLLSFKEIEDRTAIERLRGSQLFAEIEIDQESEDGTYHVEQLIGLRVLTEAEVELGKVSDVLNLPGQDLLEVETSRGERLIPMVEEFILDIDLTRGVIIVRLPEGLLD
jgi:16S rRNA processing protein RimM